jgi:uncharacterized protein (DUF305 family)
MYKRHKWSSPVQTAAAPRRWRRLAPVLLVALAVLAAAGCTDQDEPGPKAVQPGAPGEPGRVIEPGEAGNGAEPHTEVDVRFVQAMIAHHAQALELTSLVPARARHADIPRLAQRIEISQADEIALMQGWLAARGEPVPPTDHDHGTGELMPGMLTEQQLTELSDATGPDFDRRFLESMIYHHEGALIMVEELLDRGGGHQAELFQLITHIDSDQRIEIGRMRDLLVELALAG